jgi:hypothetical protein
MVLELAPRDEEFSAGFYSVFARWRAALVSRFEPLGIAPGRAAVLASLTIPAFEGALVLSRADRTRTGAYLSYLGWASSSSACSSS